MLVRQERGEGDSEIQKLFAYLLSGFGGYSEGFLSLFFTVPMVLDGGV